MAHSDLSLIFQKDPFSSAGTARLKQARAETLWKKGRWPGWGDDSCDWKKNESKVIEMTESPQAFLIVQISPDQQTNKPTNKN